MKTLQDIMNAYHAKWDKYIQDNNISEDDERHGCWGWQFDGEHPFINTPELLLASYIYGYDHHAIHYLHEHFIEYHSERYTEMAKQAIELYNSLTPAVQ